MGIPYYFKNITSVHPDILSDYIIFDKVDVLAFDFNCVIHQIANTLMTKHAVSFDSDCFETQVLSLCVDFVNDIHSIVKSRQILISIDGVVPLAKMIQQRKRRYLNSFKKQLTGHTHIWDTNAISPGTIFMQKLNDYLHKTKSENKFHTDTIIIDSNEPGEGETKIYNFLDHHNVRYSVIYGLDADLIMLSMISNIKHNSHILLMRESKYINPSIESDSYTYLNTCRLQTVLHKYMCDISNHSTFVTSHNDSIMTYIFLCFFIGNDFIPNLSFLKIKNHSIDFMISCYDKIHHRIQQHLIQYNSISNQYSLNTIFLCSFIEELSIYEDSEYAKNHSKFYDRFIKKTKDNLIEFYPIFNKPNDTIQPYEKGWRERYYSALFENTNKNEICKQYLIGLQWVVDYYLNKNCCTNWCYPYDFSPTILDLSNYIIANSTVINDVFEDYFSKHKGLLINTYFSPDIQLLYILPKSSSHLLKNEHKAAMYDIDKELIHYYPISFKIQTYLANYLHECIPKLPFINIQHLFKFVDSFKI